MMDNFIVTRRTCCYVAGCVLCCRICFDPYGSVYGRDAYHNPKLVEDPEEAECCKRDVGRVGNNASVKCTVCNVFLCDNKARFPNCEKTCWEVWHTATDLSRVLEYWAEQI
jgi:hypothetical protein